MCGNLRAPLILSNISVAILGIVDTAVVGHLEEAYYLGAVAVAAIIFNFLYWGKWVFCAWQRQE